MTNDETQPPSSETNSDYEDYVEERAMLAEMEQDHYKGYEKTITTLAAGFLAFSLSFLGLFDKEGRPSLNDTLLLYWSWSLFGVSVVSVLVNYLVGGVEIRQQIHRAARVFEGEEVSDSSPLTAIGFTLYACAGAAFVGGIVLLMLFCGHNLAVLWP